MPKKICPQCNASHGVRRLVCDCGHDFQCKRAGKAAVEAGQVSHPLYPEPGAWVADKMKGMPDILPPEPISSGPIDASTIKDVVSYEGLGFAIYSFISANRISDLRLQKLWREARAAMQKVEEYLEDVSLSGMP